MNKILPIENVDVSSVNGEYLGLGCTYKGARYHIWANPKDLTDISGRTLYKNPLQGARNGPDYFPTRHLDVDSQFSSQLVAALVYQVTTKGLIAKYYEQQALEQQQEEQELQDRARLQTIEKAGPELLEALKWMRRTFSSIHIALLDEPDKFELDKVDELIAKIEGKP